MDRYLAVAAAVLILGGIIGACGGTAALSAGEYFTKLEAIAREAQEKENAAQPSEEDAASLTPDEAKAQGIQLLDASATIDEDALKKLEDLRPPKDLQEAHDRLVAAEGDMAMRFRGFADQVRDLPAQGVEDFFNSQVFVQATFADFDEACSALQALAAEKSVDVNLNCEPEE